MTLPGKVATQLHAVLKKDSAADRIALVWPKPPDTPLLEYEAEGVRFRVVYCPSELAIREQLVSHQPNGERLVLLSPFDQTQLTRDVLARIWKNNTLRISPWRTLQDLLSIREIDPRLGKHAWLAEALVSSYDRYKNKIGSTEVLDIEKAWRALAIALLDFDAPQNDIQSILQWSLAGSAKERFSALPEEVKQHLGEWLELGASQYSTLVLALLEAGHGDNLVAIGLAAQVLFHASLSKDQDVLLARGRFAERYCGGRKIPVATIRALGEEASALINRLLSQGQEIGPAASQLASAEHSLATLDASDLAVLSDLLPVGFQQRLEKLAKAIQKALKAKQCDLAIQALTEVRRHQQAVVRPDRVERAEMSVRLVQWLQSGGLLEAPDAKQSVRNYAAEGGFLDWARTRIWAGDENDELDRAYQAVTKKVAERREASNGAFSKHLSAVARGDAMGPEVLPVESLLDEVLAPLAKDKPVLLLVMDGMSQAVYEELADDLVRKQWIEYRDSNISSPRSLLSALPSITRVSRTSLFAGALTSGAAADEKKLFSGHGRLKAISTRFPPMLFHKADLIQTGGGGLAGSVREIVAGRERRIVGVVINAVDDLLNGGAQVAVSWHVDQMTLLRQLLEAARESGRAVVMTSDHGHVIDHDMKYRASTDSGERYREDKKAVADDECLVEGPRVLTEGGAAVLPWSEKVRYGGNKFGYHGGGSLQEVVIPLGVFLSAPDQEIPASWNEVPREYPGWWDLESDFPSGVKEAASPPLVAAKKKKKRVEVPTQAGLFDQEDVAVESEDWVASFMGSSVLAQQKAKLGRVPISDKQLGQLVQILSQSGGHASLTQLAQDLKLPRIRLGGFLSGVRRLLNLDGYPVLSIDRDSGAVIMNIELLKTQFEL